MDSQFGTVFDTPIGTLGIVEKDGYITKIILPNEKKMMSEIYLNESEEIKKAKKEIEEYFAGARSCFTFKYKYSGTKFREMVWNELISIPYGETRSYKDVAISIGNPLACRAVGQANNKNNLPIIIPCHRVIGSNESYVGYAGGIEIKKYLLNLEKHNI